VTADLNGPPYESLADVLSVRVNWPWLGTLANILVSGALHAVLPLFWGEPAMLVRSSPSFFTFDLSLPCEGCYDGVRLRAVCQATSHTHM
jgi:hypothetical protein